MRFIVAWLLLLGTISCVRSRTSTRAPEDLLAQEARARQDAPAGTSPETSPAPTLLGSFAGRRVQVRVQAEPVMRRWVSLTTRLVEGELRQAKAGVDPNGPEILELYLARKDEWSGGARVACIVIRSRHVQGGAEFLPGHLEVNRCGSPGNASPFLVPELGAPSDGLIALIAATDAAVHAGMEAMKKEEPPQVVEAYTRSLAETLSQLDRKAAARSTSASADSPAVDK